MADASGWGQGPERAQHFISQSPQERKIPEGAVIRILIADDHKYVREGLKMIVSDAEDMVVAAEASDGEEVLDKLKTDDFDVMVLDISMPGKSGLDVLRELRARGKETPVLLISTYAQEEYRKKAIEQGANGFLSKGDAPEKLIDAIREVSRSK